MKKNSSSWIALLLYFLYLFHRRLRFDVCSLLVVVGLWLTPSCSFIPSVADGELRERNRNQWRTHQVTFVNLRVYSDNHTERTFWLGTCPTNDDCHDDGNVQMARWEPSPVVTERCSLVSQLVSYSFNLRMLREPKSREHVHWRIPYNDCRWIWKRK